MKRWIVAAGAALATIAATAIVAPAAQAGIDQPYVWVNQKGTCYVGSPLQTSQDLREITVTGNPGDSFVFVNIGCGDATMLLSGGVLTGPRAVSTNGGRATYTLGNTPGTGTMVVFTPLGDVGINIVVTATPVITPVADAHDTIQQVGVPASGDCADVRPSAGHYPGFPYGGWSRSWAYWINNATGGPVCTREIYYDYGLAEWRYVGQQ